MDNIKYSAGRLSLLVKNPSRKEMWPGTPVYYGRGLFINLKENVLGSEGEQEGDGACEGGDVCYLLLLVISELYKQQF